MKTKCGACLVVVMLSGLTPARAAEQSTGTVIRTIQVVEDGGITHVTIDADGPLPLPVYERLIDPPRIYFDLAGVTPRISGTTVTQGSGVVSRVRVAQRPVSTIVTRVVLDLTRPEGFRVNTDERQAGRIRVLVGSESAINPAPAKRVAVAPPAASASANSSSSSIAATRIAGKPAPPVTAGSSAPAKADNPGAAAPPPPSSIAPPAPTRSPVLSPQPPRPALPAHEVAIYRKQIYGKVERMEALRALVSRIDAGENVGSDALVFAAQDFTDLRRFLETVKPSAVLAVTHHLLMTSCTFGAMAFHLGIDAARENNPETRRRAASAAAGSLMLFDRACADLGCARTPR